MVPSAAQRVPSGKILENKWRVPFGPNWGIDLKRAARWKVACDRGIVARARSFDQLQRDGRAALKPANFAFRLCRVNILPMDLPSGRAHSGLLTSKIEYQ
jgi:hypothetical protein